VRESEGVCVWSYLRFVGKFICVAFVGEALRDIVEILR